MKIEYLAQTTEAAAAIQTVGLGFWIFVCSFLFLLAGLAIGLLLGFVAGAPKRRAVPGSLIDQVCRNLNRLFRRLGLAGVDAPRQPPRRSKRSRAQSPQPPTPRPGKSRTIAGRVFRPKRPSPRVRFPKKKSRSR